MSEQSGSATQMEHRSDEAAREKVMEIAKSAKVAMMGTYDAKGMVHARPMVAVRYDDPEDGAALWFFTRDGSRKVDEIEADPRVLLCYSDEGANDYLSIEGRAVMNRDRALAKELWSEPMRTWFPDGPEDDALVMVKVTPEAAEYWDSPSGLVVFAYGYAKAVLTGEAPDVGETAHVKM